MKDIDSLARQAAGLVSPLLFLALLVMIVATILQQMGFGIRAIRTPSPADLAYLAGAVWLWRKA